MNKEFETIIEPLDWPSEWEEFIMFVEQQRKQIEKDFMLPLSLLEGEEQWTLIFQRLKLEIQLDFLVAAYCMKWLVPLMKKCG